MRFASIGSLPGFRMIKMQSSTSYSSHESSPLPRNVPHDFPPLPKCFLHLLHHNSEINLDKEEPLDANTASQSLKMDKFIMNQDLSPDHVDCSKGAAKMGSNYSESMGKNVNKFLYNQNVDDSIHIDQEENLHFRTVKTKDTDPDIGKRLLGKLNSSLSKLKREMTDLRTLDVSLFFQLLSLHEAIQDFKNSVGDRFSETGSEYSLGSASYMGSLSSLSEEDTEWLEGLQSHSSAKSLEDSQVFEHSQSASSLLDQITALVKKTDDDF